MLDVLAVNDSFMLSYKEDAILILQFSYRTKYSPRNTFKIGYCLLLLSIGTWSLFTTLVIQRDFRNLKVLGEYTYPMQKFNYLESLNVNMKQQGERGKMNTIGKVTKRVKISV